jgi:predicted small integral membrane protein
MIAAVLVVCAFAATEESSMRKESKQLPCVTLREATERARGAAAGATADAVWQLTPPLAAAWPARGQPVAVFFAYISVPLPTSTARWEIHSPSLRVDVDLADASTAPRVTVLRSRTLPGSEESTLMAPTPEAMEQAGQALLERLCAADGHVPAGAAADAVRGPYREWVRAHRTLAAELRKYCRTFFHWLESEV